VEAPKTLGCYCRRSVGSPGRVQAGRTTRGAASPTLLGAATPVSGGEQCPASSPTHATGAARRTPPIIHPRTTTTRVGPMPRKQRLHSPQVVADLPNGHGQSTPPRRVMRSTRRFPPTSKPFPRRLETASKAIAARVTSIIWWVFATIERAVIDARTLRAQLWSLAQIVDCDAADAARVEVGGHPAGDLPGVR
jgi:hypothetical protein